MSDFSIVPASSTTVSDLDLENLLRRVYVLSGLTDVAVGDVIFRASAVRARGELLIARDILGNLAGLVITVFPGSPACRFAAEGEAELHLLCVSPDHRHQGIGSALVAAAIATARNAGASRIILWTQPSMEAARHIYARHGFERVPELDFSRGDRSFQVFASTLD